MDWYRIYDNETHDYVPTVIRGLKRAKNAMNRYGMKEPRYRLEYYYPAEMVMHPEHKKLLGVR